MTNMTAEMPRSNNSFSSRRGGPHSHRSSLVSHHETDVGHADVRRKPSSKMSRTSSLARIRSDVSEYDVQGNLTKRTITTSYTSISDAAATPLQRYRSGPGPQAPLPVTDPPSAPASNTHAKDPASVFIHSSADHGLHCPFCSESRRFDTRAALVRHMCNTHPDCVAHPQKHEKLKQAYRRRGWQLRRALVSLTEDTQIPNSHKKSIRDEPWISQAFESLDLDPVFDFQGSTIDSIPNEETEWGDCSDEDDQD